VSVIKVLLLPNFNKEDSYKIVSEVIAQLKEDNIDILALLEDKKEINDDCIRYISLENISSDISFVIAIGGDGTIIKAANLILEYEIPIIGVNLGTLGFLAGIEKGEIALLHNLVSGKYSVEERLTLQTTIKQNDKITVFTAVNDIIISKSAPSGILNIDVLCSDIETARYRADGVILSTASGSTAYAMSAGGPIIHPSVKAINLTPICSHSLLSRPIILPEFEKITIKTNANMNDKQAFVVADGLRSVQITKDDEILVSRYEKNIKFINLDGKSYYSAINSKLIER